MKDLKTTIAGLIGGLPLLADALMQAYSAGTFTGKTGMQLSFAICLVLVAYFAKDKTKNVE